MIARGFAGSGVNLVIVDPNTEKTMQTAQSLRSNYSVDVLEIAVDVRHAPVF